MKPLNALPFAGLLLAIALVCAQTGDDTNRATAQSDPSPGAGGAFRLLLPPVKRTGEGWRISWTSAPGKAYLLQRWATDDLNTVADPAWMDVATVVAKAEMTSAEDPTSIDAARRFYRVVQLPETGGDQEPPSLDPITVQFTASGGRPAALLTLVARDNVGVRRVIFFNGSSELGVGQAGVSNRWSFTLPLDPKELGARFLSARAVDAAGNVAHSTVFPLGLVDPDHFVPLDSSGLPVEGGIVTAVGPGEWGPVEYRPGGRNLLGFGPGFFLRFPNGVRLLTQDGRQLLEFVQVTAGFGASYPIQLDRALQRTSGPAKRLGVGPLDLADLFGLFDLKPEAGLEVKIFNRFPLRWHGGIVEDGGIRAARFGFVSTGLPLPGISGNYPDFVIDFTRSRGLRIPFHGTFELPDGTRSPFKLKVGDAAPLWLSMEPDGNISLVGAAEAILPSGGKVRVDVSLDDPEYRLQFSADGLRVRALGSFADLLPSAPGVCIPAAAGGAAALDEATRCLNAFALAYQHFNASVAATSTSGNETPAAPPEPFNTVSSIVEAWAFSALANTTQRLPLNGIREAVQQLGQSASASPSLEDSLHHRLALMRAVQAVQSNAASSTPESRTDLESALAEAESAALAQANAPDATLNLGNLTSSARLILETEALRQQLGRPTSALVTTALPALMQRFAERYAAALGVRAGVFTPLGNPTITTMNRFTAAEHVHKLVDFLATVQLLGIDLAATRIDEALGQLAERMFETANADAAIAERNGDLPGFMLAFQDVLDVIAARQLAVFPSDPSLNALLPSVEDIGSFARRLNTLLEQELTKPLGERTVNNLAAEIRALLRVFRQLPSGVTIASAPLLRAYDGMEAALNRAVGEAALASENSSAALLQLLEAGTLHAELGRRFNFAAPVSWETTRLPLVVARIAEVVQQQSGWSELNQAARTLIDSADRLGLAVDQAKRKIHLQQAAVLLGTARSIARSLLQKATPVLATADMLLPGDIVVDKVAGSIRYHRFSGDLAGSFRGALQLPKFGAALTINNASFGRGGQFDLNASGQFRVPAENPALTATVPASDPIHVSWNASQGLRLTGGAGFTLANGMSFKGSVGLVDPIYRFSLEAGGLESELFKAMLPKIPALPAQSAFVRNGVLDDAALDLWSTFYDNLGKAFDHAAPSETTVAASSASSDNAPIDPNDHRRALLRAWGDMVAIGRYYGNASDMLATFEPASELALNVRKAEAFRLNNFAVRSGEVGGEPEPPVVAIPPAPPKSFDKVLQFDFGSREDDYRLSAQSVPPAAGQAHGAETRGTPRDYTLLPPDAGHWNAVGTNDLKRPLVFADGSAATGIQLILGLADDAPVKGVNTNRQPEFIFVESGLDQLGGIYNSDLMQDSLSGVVSSVSTRGDDFSVRIRGLPPGFYYAVAMIGHSKGSILHYDILTGTNRTQIAELHKTTIRPSEDEGPNPVWAEGGNYVLGRATLTAPGQELVVVSRGIPTPRFGKLSGLQILKPQLRLLSFDTGSKTNSLGKKVTLRWEVHHAEKLTLSGSDGTTQEVNGSEVDLIPTRTTVYTLTAENRNGPPQSLKVKVVVVGDSPEADNITSVVLDAQNEDCDLEAMIDECAERQKRGEDCTVPIDELEESATLNDTEIVARLLGTEQCKQVNLETAANVVNFVLDRASNRGISGFTNDVLTPAVGSYAACVANEAARRTGLTNTVFKPDGTVSRHEIDTNLVATFSIPESARLLSGLLDLQAKASLVGGDPISSTEHLLAHAENILRKIIAAAPANVTVADRLKDKQITELGSMVRGYLAAQTALAILGIDLSSLPLFQDATAAMNGVAESLIARVDQEFAGFQDGLLAFLAQRGFWAGPFFALQDLDILAKNGHPELAAAVRSRALRILEMMDRESESSGELVRLEPTVLRFCQPYLGDAAFRVLYERRIVRGLQFIASRLPATRPWTLDEFDKAPKLVDDLADLHLLIKQAQGIPLTIPDTVRVEFLARGLVLNAEEATRRSAPDPARGPFSLDAIRLLSAFNRAIVANRIKLDVRLADPRSRCKTLPKVRALADVAPVPDTLAVAFASEWFRTVKLAADITEARRQQLTAAPAGSLFSDLKLPASFKIDRVFGELYYNRLNGFLQGGFGGRVVFPQENVVFDIRRATLASDGSFSIDAGTTTPLPFGRLGLTANLQFSSTRSGGLDISGSGQLRVPVNTATQLFDVTFTYDQSARRLAASTLARNLNLRFTDDFALFDAGFGFDVSLDSPQGRLTATGSAGLFAKQKPLPDSITRTHFQLIADAITTSFSYGPEGFAATLDNGTLRLPDLFSTSVCPTNLPGPVSGPAISLSPAAPIAVTYRTSPQSIAFSGALDLRNLGFQVPGFTNFAVEVCSATLLFPSNRPPELANLNASVQLPIPGQTNRVDLLQANWSLDGFPTGTMRLRDDLRLFDQGGFTFAVLGAGTNSLGTRLTVTNLPGGPRMELAGGIELGVPGTILSGTNGSSIRGRAEGSIAIRPGHAPEFAIGTLSVTAQGGFYLGGGTDGLLIQDASLIAEGISNLFRLDPEHPFILRLSGKVGIPDGPLLGLDNARFLFDGRGIPLFSFREARFDTRGDFQLAPGFPIQITSGSLRVKNQDVPLPLLVSPTNLIVGLSANVNIPPGPKPVVTGEVDDLQLQLENGVLRPSLDGIGFGVSALEVPPLSLSGRMFIGGLRSVAAPRRVKAASFAPAALGPPQGLYFAGRLGGKFDGVGVIATVAMDLNGIIGVCLDGGLGPAGIPLGPTGFLLTGASGGIAFGGTGGDPCEFTTFFPLNGAGQPVEGSSPAALTERGANRLPEAAMTWDDYALMLERTRREQAILDVANAQGVFVPGLSQPAPRGFARQSQGMAPAAETAPATLDCPTGDCPPPSVNILAQPHPDASRYPNRIIFKFSSMDETFLNDLGITRSFIDGLGLTTADGIAGNVAGRIRTAIRNLTPSADPALLGADLARQLNALVESQLAGLELLFTDVVRIAIQPILQDRGRVYDAIVEAAFAGVPFPSTTLSLRGTFTHAVVSTFLSGTVGVVSSGQIPGLPIPPGSSGITGSINLLGVPVGFGKAFLTTVDGRGAVNPSFCGDMLLALGPLELGRGKMELKCDGCAETMLNNFGQLIGCLGQSTVNTILARVAPGKTTAQLTPEEKLGFLAHLFSQPPLLDLAPCFLATARDAFASVDPRFTYCAEFRPRLFGLPLSPSLVGINATASKSGIAAAFNFSPSFLIGNLILCTSTAGQFCQPIFPGVDNATLGFGLGFPDPTRLLTSGLEGRLNSAAAVGALAREGLDQLLANATFTIGYEFSPFGLRALNAQARVVTPNLTAHPARPGFNYVRPEDRNRGLPSRRDLILAALDRDLLKNPLWKGTTNDIHLAYLEGTPERRALQNSGLNFATDYFPHGGMLGAARLTLPKMLVDAPPIELAQIFSPTNTPLDKLGIGVHLIQDYILAASDVGALAFYVPAPNPPTFTDQAGRPLGAGDLLAAMQSFDPSNVALGNLYPLGQAFLGGYLDGRLLGIPVLRATVEAIPADPARGVSAHFKVFSEIPRDSWLSSFVERARMSFEIRQSPALPIDRYFSNLVARAAARTNSVESLVAEMQNSMADAMPKVSLELAIENVRTPSEFAALLAPANASARLVAYSPRFNPSFVGTNPVALVTREGGIALQGSFRFANLVTVANAELAVAPKLVGPPKLSGDFNVPFVGVNDIGLHDARLIFNTEPAVRQPFLLIAGAVDPIRVGLPGQPPLVEIVPLLRTTNRIAASLSVVRDGSESVSTSFSMTPAQANIPLLGPGVSVVVHGATTNDNFSFSSNSPWTNNITVRGSIALRDPAGVEVLRFGNPSQKVSGTLSGNGLAFQSIDLKFPASLRVTAFPGKGAPIEQVLDLGAPTNQARLFVSADGSFEISGAVGGPLNFPGLPVTGLAAGANFSMKPTGLTLGGFFDGGSLVKFVDRVSGSLVLGPAGVISLTGDALIDPVRFGNLVVEGVSQAKINTKLTASGLSLPSGARLRIEGLRSDVLTLAPFTNQPNGDFTAKLAVGNLNVPGSFRLTSGSMELRKAGELVTLQIESPTLMLFPGEDFATTFASPIQRVVVETSGRFYADTGNRELGLPGLFTAAGRLEFGFEPDDRPALLQVLSSTLNFGDTGVGIPSTKTLILTNSGQAPLQLSLAGTNRAFSVSPASLALPPRSVANLQVTFLPNALGPSTNVFEIFSNAGNGPHSARVFGTGRPQPIYSQSTTNLDFGERPLNSTNTRSISVRNLGTAAFNLSAVELSGPFTLVSPVPSQAIAPGSNVTVAVRFVPTTVGAAAGSVTLRTNGVLAGRVSLAGLGFDERWVMLKDGGPALRGVVQTGSRTLHAVGDDGLYLVSTNGGDAWTRRTGLDSRDFQTLYADPKLRTRTMVAAGSGGAFVSTNLGSTWRLITHPNINVSNIVWTGSTLVGSNELVLAGSFGKRGGLITRQSGPSNYVFAAAPASGLNGLAGGAFISGSSIGSAERTLLIAVGDEGLVLTSDTLGTNWTPSVVSGNPANRLLGVALSSSGVALAVGERGIVLRRNFGSSTSFGWASVPTPPFKGNLRAVAISGSIAYAVGDGGRTLRSTDAGLTWSVEDLPGGEAAFAVVTNGDAPFTVGANGQIHVRPTLPPTGPLLAYSASALDFGALLPGGVRRQTVEIFNRGVTTLRVTNIAVVGGGFTVAPPPSPVTLEPGASQTLTVSMSSFGLGLGSASLRLRSNDGDGEHLVSLSGLVRSNVWTKLAVPGSPSFADLQFTTTNIGYAIAGSQVFKSTNGGLNWAASGPAAPGPLRSLHFVSSNIGWAVGGDDNLFNPDCTGACRSTIWKTIDGGASWTSQTSGTGQAITDIHMTSSAAGFIVTRLPARSVGVSAEVLRTTDGGATWQPVTRPVPAIGRFSGTAVHAAGSVVFAAGSGHLFRSANNGGTWTRILDLPAGATINDIEFVGASGWLAGSDGFFRFTTTSGLTAASWQAGSFPYSVTDLRFGKVDFQFTTTGRMAGSRTDGSSVLFHSADGGASWVEELSESAGSPGASQTIQAVSVLSGNFGVAVGTGGGVWKLSKFSPPLQGTPNLPARLVLDELPLGSPRKFNVFLNNLGPGPLDVRRIELESDDAIADFTLDTTSLAPVASGQTASISITATPKRIGRQRAVLNLTTDGFGGNTRCDLSVEVTADPTTLIFETQPPGLLLFLNGGLAAAPISRSVVQESPGSGAWALGSTNRIEAPITQTNAGLVWKFQRWESGETRAFDYVAEEKSRTFRASYLPITASTAGKTASAIVTSATGPRSRLGKAAVTPSFDPPTGPYLRLSGARLTVPALGDLNVRGDMFLSAERITAALESGSFRVPNDPAQGAVIEIGASSWNLDYAKNAQFKLTAHGPDLDLFESPVLPPSLLELNFKKGGDFTATFETTEDLRVVDGFFEMGPGRISLEKKTFLSLTVSGEVRALKAPNGNFAIRKPIDFKASEGPFTFALTNLPSTLLDLGAVKITRDNAASGLFLNRNASGAFNAAISNINFSLLGAPPTRISASASGSALTLQVGGSIPLGPFRLDHTSTASRAILAWNLRTGSINFNTPAMLVKSGVVPGWPSAGVPVPGLQFDSGGDFNHTVLLPDLVFDGIALRDATDPAKHYLQLKRSNQKTEVHLRDEREFIGNTMKVGFDLKQTSSTNPSLISVSGFFRGTIALQDTPVLGDIDLGSVDLSYDSTEPDFQFQGLVKTLIADFSVNFGSGGGRVCHMNCNDDGCTMGIFCLP